MIFFIVDISLYITFFTLNRAKLKDCHIFDPIHPQERQGNQATFMWPYFSLQ